jgi:flagellar protein FliJ
MDHTGQKGKSVLPLLIRLARERSETALRTRQVVAGNMQQAERKLNSLTSFLAEYQNRLMHSSRDGVDQGTLENYRLFLAKLNQAVSQQDREVGELRTNLAAAQADWQGEELRRLSFSKLHERQETKRTLAEARQSQKLLDAYATQSAARKNDK